MCTSSGSRRKSDSDIICILTVNLHLPNLKLPRTWELSLAMPVLPQAGRPLLAQRAIVVTPSCPLRPHSCSPKRPRGGSVLTKAVWDMSSGTDLHCPPSSCLLVLFRAVLTWTKAVYKEASFLFSFFFFSLSIYRHFVVGRSPQSGPLLSVWLVTPAEPRQSLPAKPLRCCVCSRSTCQHSYISVQHRGQLPPHVDHGQGSSYK